MVHEKYNQKTKLIVSVCLSVLIIGCLSSVIYHGSANAQNKTSIEPTGIKSATTNATKINIVLVHGHVTKINTQIELPCAYLPSQIYPIPTALYT